MTTGFVSLKEVFDQVYRYTIAEGVTEDDIINDAIELIKIIGYPSTFEDKTVVLEVKNHKAVLPCDLYSITQVQCPCQGDSLSVATDVFDIRRRQQGMPTYRADNNILFTSEENGSLILSYKALKLDSEGFPMISDDGTFQRALVSYVIMKSVQDNFYQGKVDWHVMNHAERDYAFNVAQATTRLATPSLDEMENLARMIKAPLLNQHSHRIGYSDLNNIIEFKKH